SKGMRRRIGLAQSLLHDPELIVLDEPTNGLDPVGIIKVKQLLRGLKARGRTIVISSHILPEMEDLCDRVAVLAAGRVLASDLLASSLAFEASRERGPTAPRRRSLALRGVAAGQAVVRGIRAAGGEGVARPGAAREEVDEEAHRVGEVEAAVVVHVRGRDAGG